MIDKQAREGHPKPEITRREGATNAVTGADQYPWRNLVRSHVEQMT
jgi:hypothetical protein